MSANVALTDTFDTWRTRTNSLLLYTQDTVGGVETLKIANTADATSNTTGSVTTLGGVSVGKTAYIGEQLNVEGDTTLTKDLSVAANTSLGSAATEQLIINASLASNVLPLVDSTSELGSITKRFAALYVNGVVGSNTVSSLQVPAGTTVQRAGETGAIRYNSDLNRFEGNTGTNFVHLGDNIQDVDGDTKITLESSSDEDYVRIFTGNSLTLSTERVNISQGGNVGIGSGATAGDAKLQVVGTANISQTVTLGNVLTVGGNLKATGAYANISTTEYITLKTPTVTIDSNNTIITGNLVVQGSRTYIDTTHQVSQDKTIVLGTGSDVFSNSTFTAADPTTIVSRRNNSNTAHSLTNGDMILVVSSSDTTNIPAEALYSVTTVNTIAFTIDIVGAPSGAGTLDWTGPQLDASIDDGGLIIAGNTVHKFTWDNADDAWHLTDSLVVAGDVTVTSNIIKNSDGEAAITMNADRETTFANSIQINGNVIRESGGVDTITMHANTNVTIAGDLQVSGNQIKASTGDDTQSFIGANVSFPGRITFASGAAANTILVGSSTGLLTHAAFGIYDSAGVRLGPG